MKENAIVDRESFKKSSFSSYFTQEPIGFMDIGARGGSHTLVEPLHAYVSYLGFEPDLDECHALNHNQHLKSYWNGFEVLPHALSNEFGKRTLNMLSFAANSSLLDLNDMFVERYKMHEKWTVTHQVPLETCPLDHVIYDLNRGFKHSGEIIKIDVQGVELEILEGAKKLLSDQTVCMVAEVEFFQIYKDQKLFSDVELYLRSLGFSFYGFFTLHTRSKKTLNKKTHHGKERLFYADAVFFKDPFSTDVVLTQRQYKVLMFSAILTGYFDFALEIATSDKLQLDAADLACIKQLVADLSFVDPIKMSDQVLQLANKVEANKNDTNVYLGKFVDSIQFPDFEDVAI